VSMLKKLKGSKLSLAQTYHRFNSLIFHSASRMGPGIVPDRLRHERLAGSAQSRDGRSNPDAAVLKMLTDAAQSMRCLGMNQMKKFDRGPEAC
jgi:hypothetical protein